MFQPLNRLKSQGPPSLYHQVVNNIRELVLKGQLKIGEKLPSERELAEMYGVSRVPVREALKTLEFMGIVQSLRGDGVYVREIQTSDLLENIEFAVQDDVNDMLLELFEAREAIEVKAVQLAALRRTDEDLEEMQEAVLDMERDLLLNRDASMSSYKFHLGIIKASHNRVIYRIHDSLSDLSKLSRRKSLGVKGRSEVAFHFHKQLLQKIREKNAEEAGAIMVEHLRHASLAIEKMKSHCSSDKDERDGLS